MLYFVININIAVDFYTRFKKFGVKYVSNIFAALLKNREIPVWRETQYTLRNAVGSDRV